MSAIIHLSDLHLTDDASWDNLAVIAEVIKKDLPRPPQLLVVSGDFLNHPDDGAMARLGRVARKVTFRKPVRRLEHVSQELEKIRASCAPGCQLVVVPGNHDHRNFGNFAARLGSRSFDRIFERWREAKTATIDGRLVCVFTLDSNTNNPRINSARGMVGKKEYLRFRGEFSRLEKAHPNEFASALKIVVLHHHPLPIADSDKTGITNSDAFLGLDDSGIFLREMATHQIDIVLHGHKHHAFNSRIEIAAPSVRRGLAVIAAGSATKDREPERSFNVLHLDQRSVRGELWRLKTGAFGWIRESFPIVSYDRYLARAFEDFRAEPKITHYVERLIVVHSINSAGDSQALTQYFGLKPKESDSKIEITVQRKCEHGTFSGHVWRMLSPADKIARYIADRSASSELKGVVQFEPELQEGDVVDVEQRYRLYNAFALNQEQRARIVDGKTDSSTDANTEVVNVSIGRPIVEMTIRVHFAEYPMPGHMHVVVRNGDGNEDGGESDRCRGRLFICHASRTASLSVTKPLRGCRYQIVWNLPQAPSRRNIGGRTNEGRCTVLKRELLDLHGEEPKLNPLNEIFAAESNRLAEGEAADQIEIGLMVYDPAIKRLRFVAGELRPSTWNYRLFEGQGVAGRAHKIDQALVVFPNQVSSESDFAAPAAPGAQNPEVIICVPLRYPILPPSGVGETIGVLTVSTYYEASKLLNQAEKDGWAELFAVQSQELFARMLAKLGHANWIDQN
jgi:3',5'-cyclic AMP phosphodiesterase CpdA